MMFKNIIWKVIFCLYSFQIVAFRSIQTVKNTITFSMLKQKEGDLDFYPHSFVIFLFQ